MEFVRRLGGFLMPGGRMGAVGARQQAAPFTPFLLGWEAAYWASDPDWTAPADGGAVSSWRDGSGHSHTLTQATSGARPLYRSAVTNLNGRPGIDFDGVDDFLALDAFAFAQPLSIVIIAADWVAGAENKYLFGSGFPPCVFIRGTPSSEFNAYGGSVLGAGFALDAPGHMWRTYLNGDGGASAVAKDASVIAGDGGSWGVPNGFAIGAFTPLGDRGFLDMNIAFVGLAAGNITTDPKWAAFKAWVASFYGITV